MNLFLAQVIMDCDSILHPRPGSLVDTTWYVDWPTLMVPLPHAVSLLRPHTCRLIPTGYITQLVYVQSTVG